MLYQKKKANCIFSTVKSQTDSFGTIPQFLDLHLLPIRFYIAEKITSLPLSFIADLC